MREIEFSIETSRGLAGVGATITDKGLTYQGDICLARMATDIGPAPRCSFFRDGGRALALMSLAAGRSIPTLALNHLEAAAAHWQRGDKVLANLRLAFARLPRLADQTAADRLRLAAYLLDEGMGPATLMKELGFDAVALELEKYDASQPRVPAGSGRESGRWTKGGGDADASRIAFMTSGVASTFLAGASSSIIDGLIAIATRAAAPLVLFGAVFVPTPNTGGVVEGPLPGAADVTFKKDGPEGTLRLTAQIDDGLQVVVAAENRAGLYVNMRTGEALGRDLGDHIYLDLQAVHAAVDTEVAIRTGEAPDRRPQAAIDEPQLCPMPMKDVGHHASESALDYEDDVHARVNPLVPLPRGFGVNLIDPQTGRPVYFDDCLRYAGDLVDGDMRAGDLVEAKGTVGFLLSGKVGTKPINDFLTQAEKALRTADARGVGLKYYFAERAAADDARALLKSKGFDRIVVGFMPRRKSK